MSKNTKSKSIVLLALLAATAIATGAQHEPQSVTVGNVKPCFSNDGNNALTIALTPDANQHIDGIYIRRKGSQQWSQNLGVVLPGKSIHIFNLNDGEIEIFWREKSHTFGVQPALSVAPPTHDEWKTTNAKQTISLDTETHRRIVVS